MAMKVNIYHLANNFAEKFSCTHKDTKADADLEDSSRFIIRSRRRQEVDDLSLCP